MERWPSIVAVCVGWLLVCLLPECAAEFSVTDLFMNTLRTRFDFACDGELLTIKCPQGTFISLQNANYGRRVPSSNMCPLPWRLLQSQKFSFRNEDTNCKAADSLQILRNNCEDRSECTVAVNNTLSMEDPCPGTYKYLDVSFKCKPKNFIQVETCKNDHMNIYCQGTGQVLAIYKAHYGRLLTSTTTCPSYTMTDIECQTADALERVMRHCHGRRHCILKSSPKLFGDPCPPDTMKYLVVLYACVSRSIFRRPRRFLGQLPPLPSVRVTETSVSKDMVGVERTVHPSFSDSIGSYSSDSGGIYNESTGIIYPNFTTLIPKGDSSSSDSSSGFGDFVNSMILFVEFMKEKKYVFIQYFIMGCLIGIIMALIAWVVHLKRKKTKLKHKMENGGTGSRANGCLAAMREENRIDIDEIWRSPPPLSVPTSRISPTEDDNDNTIWRSHTLPGRRQLNSYFP